MEELSSLQDQFDKLNSAVMSLQQTVTTVNNSVSQTAQKIANTTNQATGVFTNNIKSLDSFTSKLQQYTSELTRLSKNADKFKNTLGNIQLQKLIKTISQLQKSFSDLDTNKLKVQFDNLQNSINEFDASSVAKQVSFIKNFLQELDITNIEQQLLSLQNSLEVLDTSNIYTQLTALQNSLQTLDVSSLTSEFIKLKDILSAEPIRIFDSSNIQEQVNNLQNSLQQLNVETFSSQLINLQNLIQETNISSVITEISKIKQNLGEESFTLFNNNELVTTTTLLQGIGKVFKDIQASASNLLQKLQVKTLQDLVIQVQPSVNISPTPESTSKANNKSNRDNSRQASTNINTQNRGISSNDKTNLEFQELKSLLEKFLLRQERLVTQLNTFPTSTGTGDTTSTLPDRKPIYFDDDVEQTLKNVLETNELLNDQIKNLEQQQSSKTLIRRLNNQLLNQALSIYNTTLKELATQSSIEDIVKNKNKLAENANTLEFLRQQLISQEPELLHNINQNIDAQIANIEKVNKELNKQMSILKDINSNRYVKITDVLSDITSKIPGLSKLSGPFKAMNESVREAAANNKQIKELADGYIASNEKLKGINQKIASFGETELKTGKGLTKEKLKQLGLDKITGQTTGRTAGNLLKTAREQNKAQIQSNLAAKSALKNTNLLSAVFKGLGPIIRGALGPVGIILMVVDAVKFIISAFMTANKQTIEIARNLSSTRESARAVREQFVRISRSAGETYITLSNLIKAQSELTNQLQKGGIASDTTLKAQTFLTERMKMNGAEAAKITARSEALGENTEEVVKNIMAENAERVKTGKSVLTQKQVLEAVSKTSGQIAASFGFSNKAIADGVIKVRQFGLNLAQAQSIANGLLDFETSISNELEAELLTGRSLNLERARMKALTGDIAGATEDVMSQMKGLTAEQRKSPIIMKALSGVIGLSVDELQDAYLLETDITRQAEERLKREEQLRKVYKLSGEEAAQRYLNEMGMKQSLMEEVKKTVTLEEQYQEALAKVKDLFIGIVNDGTVELLTDQIRNLALWISKLPGMESLQAQSNAERLAGKEVITSSGEKTVITGEQAANLKEEVTSVLPGWLEMLAPALATAVNGVTGVSIARSKLKRMENTYGLSPNAFKPESFEKAGIDKAQYAKDYMVAYAPDDLATNIALRLKGFDTDRETAQSRLQEAQPKLELKNQELPVNDFTIRAHPKDTLVMAGGTKFGEETNALLRELIAAVNKGGDVYMDGNKVGQALVLSTSKLS